MSKYILDSLLTSLRELKRTDLKNGVHVQLAEAINNQFGEHDEKKVLEQRVGRLDSLRAFDIEGAESWARATMEQWNHSDAETRQIMYGGVKVAEKLLAILPKLREALAEEGRI